MTPQRTPISFIATDEPVAARTFYVDVLGLRLVEVSDFALVLMDGAQMLRVQIVAQHSPVPYTAHGWQVSDIKSEIETLGRKGVTFTRFEHLPQDDHGIWTTPDGAQIAWFTDPSGNILSLTEFPPS